METNIAPVQQSMEENLADQVATYRAEMESIVSSGTRLNINYYIELNIDPDHQEEILDYFRSAESDSVEDALEELGEDEFTLEEIRIMKIKFMSEMGN